MHPANPNTFANSPLDRAGHLRAKPEELARLRKSAAASLVLVRDGRPFVGACKGSEPAKIAWLNPAFLAAHAAGATEIFLGLDDKGPVFAADVSSLADPQEGGPLQGLGEFQDLRSLLPLLSPSDAAIIGQAKSLLDWHARHGFCAKCGAPTRLAQGGYRRDCGVCKAEHFPRTDPVAIMLAVCGDEILLGRGAQWPPKRYSALAGFIEPGETIEEGAARELFEEAGVKALSVRYLFSQPWPFPSSLMIGCVAQVENRNFKLDPEELADARWFPRAELPSLLNGMHADGCAGPPPFAIAHQLIRAWIEP
ncbi:MAG: NAD(+) diphosphatase [Alphaproteobacteria bacterium]